MHPLSIEQRLDLYRQHIERWQHLPPEKYIAPMGVRLLAIRVKAATNADYDDFVRLISCNIPIAMERVRQELEVRHNFLVERLTELPKDDPDIEDVSRELAGELAAADSYEGQTRLHAFLQRMVSRYWRLERHTGRTLQ